MWPMTMSKNLGEVCGKCGEPVPEGDGAKHWISADTDHQLACNVVGCGAPTEYYCVHPDGSETFVCRKDHQQTKRRTRMSQ